MVLAHNLMEGARTRDIEISADITFDSMLLSKNTMDGLKTSGFQKPSPIQLQGIPLGKCGFGMIKTLRYLSLYMYFFKHTHVLFVIRIFYRKFSSHT